jgi:hypothetical protein
MDILVPIYHSKSLRPTVTEIELAHSGTSEGNGLRRFMARSYQYITLTSPEPPEIIAKSEEGTPTTDQLLVFPTQDRDLERDVSKPMRNVIPEPVPTSSKTRNAAPYL